MGDHLFKYLGLVNFLVFLLCTVLHYLWTSIFCMPYFFLTLIHLVTHSVVEKQVQIEPKLSDGQANGS